MKAIFSVCLLLIGLGYLPFCCQGQEGSPDVLERFIGTWDEEAISKPTEQNPKETKVTSLSTVRRVLGGRFTLAITRSQPGNHETIQLGTYDAKAKEHRSWLFSPQGNTAEWTGQWDEETKTLSGNADLGEGTTAQRKIKVVNQDALEWSLFVKGKKGEVVADVHGKSVRRKTPPEKTKDEKVVGPPKSPELKVLDRYVGNWNTEIVNKVSERNPKEVRVSGTLTNEWVLDGRFMQMRGKSSTGVENIQMRTYDSQKKQYRAWLFDSTGTAASSIGQWHEQTKTMTWKGDQGNGITAISPVRFVGDDTIEWKLGARNEEGKVFMDMEGTFKRRK